jgi:hypothetical protein
LARTDGVVLMRCPYLEDFIATNVKQAGLFVHFPGAASGHYKSWAVSDGVKRLFVYDQVNDLPLIIVVGQSLDEIFAPWWRQAFEIGALTAVRPPASHQSPFSRVDSRIFLFERDHVLAIAMRPSVARENTGATARCRSASINPSARSTICGDAKSCGSSVG